MELQTLLDACTAADAPTAFNPVYDDDGSIFWDASHLPPLLEMLCRQIRGAFNMGKEVEGMQVRLFPPPAVRATTRSTHTILRAPMTVAARIIVCIGSREEFTLVASAGATSGTGHVACISGDAFQVTLGVASAADISFNDSTSYTMEARPGFRASQIKKDPCKRYVLVVDGLVNATVLMEEIKRKAAAISGGNTEVADRITAQMASGLGISSIDEVAAAAGASRPAPIAPTGTPLEG